MLSEFLGVGIFVGGLNVLISEVGSIVGVWENFGGIISFGAIFVSVVAGGVLDFCMGVVDDDGLLVISEVKPVGSVVDRGSACFVVSVCTGTVVGLFDTLSSTSLVVITIEGGRVGICVGTTVGIFVNLIVGFVVGPKVGSMVGAALGANF